jgi:hypothetical protein
VGSIHAGGFLLLPHSNSYAANVQVAIGSFVTRAPARNWRPVSGRLRQPVDDAQALEAFHRLGRLVG